MTNTAVLQAENVFFTASMVLYFAAMVLYFVLIAAKKERLSRPAFYVLFSGFACHTVALVLRGIEVGRLPIISQYEFAVSFAWGLSLVSLIFIRKYRFEVLGAFAAPLIFLVIGYAAMLSRESRELVPSLRSNWLGFHVSTAIIAYGSFGVSFAVALVFLVRDKIAEGSFLDARIPSKEKLDVIAYRAVSLGFLFLSFCIITGAIWAEHAWGSYWSWDPKETWSLITWLIYAAYLHQRIRMGWRGKSAAIFAVVGFICVLFTYVGVNTFLPGIHSYA